MYTIIGVKNNALVISSSLLLKPRNTALNITEIKILILPKNIFS